MLIFKERNKIFENMVKFQNKRNSFKSNRKEKYIIYEGMFNRLIVGFLLIIIREKYNEIIF